MLHETLVKYLVIPTATVKPYHTEYGDHIFFNFSRFKSTELEHRFSLKVFPRFRERTNEIYFRCETFHWPDIVGLCIHIDMISIINLHLHYPRQRRSRFIAKIVLRLSGREGIQNGVKIHFPLFLTFYQDRNVKERKMLRCHNSNTFHSRSMMLMALVAFSLLSCISSADVSHREDDSRYTFLRPNLQFQNSITKKCYFSSFPSVTFTFTPFTTLDGSGNDAR